MDKQFYSRLNLYQKTVILSVLFTLLGFSYNVWRMEASEKNNNIRTASFEILITLSSLEQLVYAAYYDGDKKEGNPRIGWINVGLINDLSILTNEQVQNKANVLNDVWSENWQAIANSQASVNQIVTAIDNVRYEIKLLLNSLE
jgi:hypothetical protein